VGDLKIILFGAINSPLPSMGGAAVGVSIKMLE
jgi:hypothetical protein